MARTIQRTQTRLILADVPAEERRYDLQELIEEAKGDELSIGLNSVNDISLGVKENKERLSKKATRGLSAYIGNIVYFNGSTRFFLNPSPCSTIHLTGEDYQKRNIFPRQIESEEGIELKPGQTFNIGDRFGYEIEINEG